MYQLLYKDLLPCDNIFFLFFNILSEYSTYEFNLV